MRTLIASRIAWTAWALSLALTALSLLLLALNLSQPGVHVYVTRIEDTLLAIGFSTIGAVVASRCPENPIGWLFCVIGFLFGVSHFCGEYAIYTLLAAPGSLPAGEAVTWIRFWIWVPYLGLGVFLFLLFPNGRLPGRGWRWFAWLSVLLASVGTVLAAFAPGGIRSLGPIQNPLGIEGLPSLSWAVEAIMFALIFIAAASLFVRLRRATMMERQQIKWVAYAAVAGVGGAILTYTVSEAAGLEWLKRAGFVLETAGVLGIPVSMGIAIMRYRLYDIDVVINRTLIYGALTAVLVAIYFSGVVLLQGLFRSFTGQESQLGVVASTVAIAALFNPLRHRIQRFIDHLFYRRKYDAAKTLGAFSARLRDEVDLDSLSDDLVRVVRETLQPTHVSLWLRPDPVPKNGEGGGSENRADEEPQR